MRQVQAQTQLPVLWWSYIQRVFVQSWASIYSAVDEFFIALIDRANYKAIILYLISFNQLSFISYILTSFCQRTSAQFSFYPQIRYIPSDYTFQSRKMRNNNSERLLQGTKHQQTKKTEGKSTNQYNLNAFNRKKQQSDQGNSEQKVRALSKRGKSELLLYFKMQEKLENIETKIEEIKANIHKKNLQRMKNNVLRSQQLQELKKKYREKKIQVQEQKENKSKNQAKNQQNKMQIKMDKIQEISSPAEKPQKKPNLSDFITQQKPISLNNPYKMSQTLHGLVTNIPESHQTHTFDTNPYSPRSNIYYVSEVIKGYKDKKSLVWQHIKTSIFLFNYFSQMRIPSNVDVKKRALNLPMDSKYEGKKTIIFDLDQTLIHCNDSLKIEHQIELPVVFPNGETIVAGINVRPGATQILQALHEQFQLMVFTASHSSYANVVIDYLDPKRQYIKHRLFREHCHLTLNGEYVKDLRIINRELKNMVLIDNAAYSYAFQPENGIPIIPYYHGDKDFQLKILTQYIKRLQFSSDVRLTNRQTFRLTRYRNYKVNEVQKLVEDLYINKIQ